MTPVFGEFRRLAAEHITAAVSSGNTLPNSAQHGVVRQLDRLAATFERYLADLPPAGTPDPGRRPEHDTAAPARPALLALSRARQALHPAARAIAAAADDDEVHPAAGHLSSAATYLATGRDLLHTHYELDPAGARLSASHWAPAVTSGPVTAALLAELASHTQTLLPWIARLAATNHARPGAPTSAQLALRAAEPWLTQAATTVQAAQQAHYPLPAQSLLDAIPINTPPPRQLPPSDDETIHELAERIALTAERLRCAAFRFAAHARWSPAATSACWRRDALASAITSHCGELILRALAERSSQLSLEPDLQTQLNTAADAMAPVWPAWQAVTSQWDILTTGNPRGSKQTLVAEEIGDLALRTGRLAYRNPHWTPARPSATCIRDPADLSPRPSDIVTVLAAVHHASVAVSQIAAADHQAVHDAADDRRLYIPVRLLSDKYDIPHPYTRVPHSHVSALLAAYDTAITASRRATAALDNLATSLKAPSRFLAAARQASPAPQAYQPSLQRQRTALQPLITAPPPGRTEQALHKLRIRDPALLLRGAVIDQAARDLLTEAAAKAHSRDTVTSRTYHAATGSQQGTSLPARVASQDHPATRQAPHPTEHQRQRAHARSTALQPTRSPPASPR